MQNFLLNRHSQWSNNINFKAMKEKLIRLFGKLLALLGFAAVGTSCEEMMRVEYGSPYATFEISGKLVDKETKEPVSGIVIVYGKEYYYIDEDGNEARRFYGEGSHVADFSDFWLHGRTDVPEDPAKLILKLTDYDSKANGHYKDTTYTIDLERTGEPDPEENWCVGVYGAEVTLELERVK